MLNVCVCFLCDTFIWQTRVTRLSNASHDHAVNSLQREGERDEERGGRKKTTKRRKREKKRERKREKKRERKREREKRNMDRSRICTRPSASPITI